jgi:hypothetical protein
MFTSPNEGDAMTPEQEDEMTVDLVIKERAAQEYEFARTMVATANLILQTEGSVGHVGMTFHPRTQAEYHWLIRKFNEQLGGGTVHESGGYEWYTWSLGQPTSTGVSVYKPTEEES